MFLCIKNHAAVSQIGSRPVCVVQQVDLYTDTAILSFWLFQINKLLTQTSDLLVQDMYVSFLLFCFFLPEQICCFFGHADVSFEQICP